MRLTFLIAIALLVTNLLALDRSDGPDEPDGFVTVEPAWVCRRELYPGYIGNRPPPSQEPCWSWRLLVLD